MDPIMQSIATALAGQAAAALGAGGKKAVERIRELVRRKSEHDPDTKAALEAADDRPADHPKVRALAERLDQLAADDPDFGNRLRDEGTAVHRELSASSGGVVNQNTGTVGGSLIQTRDIHGNITLN